MSGKKKVLLRAAAVLVVIVGAVLWTVWPRGWGDLAGNQEPTSLAGTLAVYTYEVVDETPSLGTDIWVLSAEQAEGPAISAIMDALRGGSYRGKLQNIFAYGPFQKASYSYSVDRKNADGYLDLYLVDGVGLNVSVTVYSGGLVIFKNLNSRAGLLIYQTDSVVYDALAAAVKAYGTLREK